ncbi:MAG: CDP-2,3-bis-(O-geranylgeranyl)-sn-glycerol synthase [Candidatus Micrarchaeota archaeon]|nr:CDP-2,3-bis-(O-geranylgeranyl)-sn-glycerol synthase [Candidatus Micrarchaeota archaeon]
MYLNLIYLYIIYPIIYIFPAYAANGAPILFGGGKRPLDMGRKLNGKRVFGDNKTVRGTISSIAVGVIVGLIEYPFLHYMLAVAILLAIGANFGDLTGSFIKRRIGIKSGSSFPIMDQYGFFIFAMLFALPLGHLPNVYGILFLVVLTGTAHVLTNRGANRLRLKSVPW